MSFKVGDRVRVARNLDDYVHLPTKGIVTAAPNGSRYRDIEVDSWKFDSKDLELLESKPVRYLIGWQEDEDPYQTFTDEKDEKEMKRFLKELAERDDVVKGSIEVFEVKTHFKVELTTSVKLKKA